MIAIGGGAAGLGATRSAAAEGLSALLIADGPIGGDCTWTGCVPSKALITHSRSGASFDDAIAAVHQTIEEIAGAESAEVLRGEGVDVVRGRGRCLGNGRVEVDNQVFSAKTIVLATGARAFVPPITGLQEVPYLTNENLFELTQLPQRFGIVGGGPIGCEMAMAFAGFGAKVSIIDSAPRLLPNEEPEASEVVQRVMADAGIEIYTSAGVDGVEQGVDGIRVEMASGAISVDQLLIATGRSPNTSGLGLDRIGIALDPKGHVIVDEKLQTNVEGISAAGDLTGLAPFTHAADEQARLAVGHAQGAKSSWKYDAAATPGVVFTRPEVARVGVVEADAPAGSMVAYFPLSHVDRAITDGRTDGFVKLIAAPRRFSRHKFGGTLVGATIVAERAGEMIHGPTMVLRLGMYVGRLAQVTAAYPTWTTAVQQAAGMFFRPVSGQSARPKRK